jgi:hypothetical protein
MAARSASRLTAAFALTGLILAMAPAFPAAGTSPEPASKTVAPTGARAFAKRIAERYGLAQFPQVKSIRFTFHSRREGEESTREWTWFPQADSVIFAGKDPKGLEVTAAYSRKNKYSLGSETVAGIDKEFINDEYWLLFPLHLAWDQDLELNLGDGGKLTVRYPRAGGYSPGDVYELSAVPDGTIRSWVVRRGGADSATWRADWSKPADVDGLPISLDRPGPKGFKVWFTHVKVAGIKP